MLLDVIGTKDEAFQQENGGERKRQRLTQLFEDGDIFLNRHAAVATVPRSTAQAFLFRWLQPLLESSRYCPPAEKKCHFQGNQ